MSLYNMTKNDAISEAQRGANKKGVRHYVFKTIMGWGVLTYRPFSSVHGNALLSDVVEVQPETT